MKSAAHYYVFRLAPGEYLKESILSFAREHHIEAGVIVTCVGSLDHYNLRFANQKEGVEQKGFFEIVSLTGTFSDRAAHLHISVADTSGHTTGGHLLDGNRIYTTAELAVAVLSDLRFDREIDPTYGYHELAIRPKK